MQLENVCKENKRCMSGGPSSLSCSRDFYIHVTSPITCYDINRTVLSVLNVFKTFLVWETYLWNHSLVLAFRISWNKEFTYSHAASRLTHACIKQLSWTAGETVILFIFIEDCLKSWALSYWLAVCYRNTGDMGSRQHKYYPLLRQGA